MWNSRMLVTGLSQAMLRVASSLLNSAVFKGTLVVILRSCRFRYFSINLYACVVVVAIIIFNPELIDARSDPSIISSSIWTTQTL